MKTRSLLLILLLLPISLCQLLAQGTGKFVISGTVIENGTDSPIFMSSVVIKELGLWSTSDDKGFFEITNVPAGKFTLEFSILGYETRNMVLDVKGDMKKLSIKMNVSSLSLDEVVVTAKEGGEITTASKISKQTIEHIQPSSLKDVMQLLPGSITENPTLTNMNTLSIRDIGSNSANAAGTALIVDGASYSNDANMQMLSTSTGTNSTQNNAASTAGGGVDARQVSTDNIESVEVIRGIPSVIYGDMTSGAVVVKTKAGITPWEIRLKTDPHLKQISAGKGFSISEKGGMLNFDADYAYAYSDIRTPASAYSRANFQIGYSNNFAHKVTFNVKLHGNYSNATNKSDPDLFLEDINQQRDMGLRLNINGRWIIQKPWITNIEYLVSGSIIDQFSREKNYQGSAGYTPSTTEMYDTENMGFYTQPQYYSDVKVYGRPIDAQARVTANLFGQYGKIKNKALIGFEWKMSGNDGKGKEFDPYCPPSPGSNSAFRERSYYEIPFLHRMTGYIEDNLTLPLGPTSLEIQAGARFNAIHATNISTDNFTVIEPRMNARYIFVKKKTGLREMSIRGGWGLTYKMPSMIYLFPEAAYKDMTSFNYNDFDANNFGMNVITTKKIETLNRNLRPQRSSNIEVGLEFDTKLIQGSLVYYNEKMTDGYGFITEYQPMRYTRYGYTWVNGEPSQEVLASGLKPIYDKSRGTIKVGDRILPSIQDTTFMSYSKPVNGITNNKWGVEFTLDFAQIKAINTSISISGAYMNIETTSKELTQRLYTGSTGGRTYPYVGIYGGSTTSSSGSVKDRLSTNIRFVTHIPKIAMVVTLTAQLVFMDRNKVSSSYNGQSLPYFYDEKGTRISGQEAINDTEHTKYVNPIYIMDRAGKITTFTQEMEQDDTYRNLILTTNTPTYYIRSGYPFYGMLNLRITKEIKKIATISFYANNFLNLRGRVNNSVTGYPNDRNTPIYFGAEVKIAIK